MFASSKMDSETDLIKCRRLFSVGQILHSSSVCYFSRECGFSLPSQKHREMWDKGVQEDTWINKAELVEKALQLDSCHQRLVYH